MGPLFPHRSEFTEAEVIALTQPGEDEMRRRARTPGGSAHSTHNGGQTRWKDRPMDGYDGTIPTEAVTWHE